MYQQLSLPLGETYVSEGGGEALNRICPYYTSFPLSFPLGILRQYAQGGEAVLDPFCGRGTTLYAARLLGLPTVGVDLSPVAVAITSAKLVSPPVEEIVDTARQILAGPPPRDTPTGEFWEWAYHPQVLLGLCQLREALLSDCSTPARIALRGLILGALHGPKPKGAPSYFSNQSPRTYAPKPDYAVRFWRARKLYPAPVDILEIITRRAARFYGSRLATRSVGEVRQSDSRVFTALLPIDGVGAFEWVITSPPYYGMKSYEVDQWLRVWFLGGQSKPNYKDSTRQAHRCIDHYVQSLRRVWHNTWRVSTATARMVVRFGGIPSHKIVPLEVLKASFKGSGWWVHKIERAGTARCGRRQADTFLRCKTTPMEEYDVWALKVKES